MTMLIEILSGRMDGKQYKVNSFPVSLGRLPDNTVEIQFDDFISRKHCTIFEDQGLVYIADLKSSNGTYVNDKLIINSTQLKTGDEILLGQTRLKITTTD